MHVIILEILKVPKWSFPSKGFTSNIDSESSNSLISQYLIPKGKTYDVNNYEISNEFRVHSFYDYSCDSV